MTPNQTKLKIAKVYAKLAKSLGRYPIRQEMLKKNVTRDRIRHHFGNMESLKVFANEVFPEDFAKVIDMEYFNNKTFSGLESAVKAHNRFVITTAVGGAPVHKGFLAALKTYCKSNKALLLIIPANYALFDLDQELVVNEHIVFRGIKLNSNISISPVKIDPKQVDPTVGLEFGSNGCEGTLIIGSPKQRRRPIANSASKLPHILQATGAITVANYVPRDGMPKRRDFLAEQQHVLGAVVVDIVDNNLYHFRNVEANSDGSFNDLFKKYSPSGVSDSDVEAVIQGDYHNGETDPKADAAVDEMCAIGRPRYRVLHDFADFKSTNHHEMLNQVNRAMDAVKGYTSLDKELMALKVTLEKKIKLGTSGSIVISKSNHDEFLDRYLSAGKFDDNNRIVSTKLQVMAMEGKDPLKSGLEELYGLNAKNKIIWLKRDQDFRVSKGKIEIGCHGDVGGNGKRNPGSTGMLKAYGKCVYGHCHFGEINHGAVSVGTTSYLKQRYNRGASSWSHTNCILYRDGTRQLINTIDGQWRLPKRQK